MVKNNQKSSNWHRKTVSQTKIATFHVIYITTYCLYLVKIGKISFIKLRSFSNNKWTDTLLEQAVIVCFLVLMICVKDTFIVKLWYQKLDYLGEF